MTGVVVRLVLAGVALVAALYLLRRARASRAAWARDEAGITRAEQWWADTQGGPFDQDRPEPPADVVAHLTHLREVVGVEHVGIGADYDGSDVMPQRQIDAVRQVLREVAGEREASLPRELLVVNKIDAADPVVLAQLRVALPEAVFVSAHSRAGIDELLERMTQLITAGDVEVSALLPYDRGDLLSRLHQEADVISSEHTGDGTHVHAKVTKELAGELEPYLTSSVA